MADTNSKKNQKNTKATVEVLYQRMGDRWFAFSLIGDEVFVGSLSADEINSLNEDELSGMPVHSRGNAPEKNQ